MKNKSVIIQYNKNVMADDGRDVRILKGAMFEVPSPSIAKSAHPDAQIVRYADGEKFVADRAPKKRAPRRKANTKTPAKSTATATAETVTETPQNAVESPVANAIGN